ncbi:MAG: YjdF family protein [Anaerotignaceae bacterium]
MEKTVSKLTIFFNEPFWVGIYEREDDCGYVVAKITFGAEPKDCDVYEFIMEKWKWLRFSPSVESETIADKRINPKRMQREVKKQLHNKGVGTKAQQALKLQHEQGKLERKVRSRKQREDEKQRKFELNQEKRKNKHRGH